MFRTLEEKLARARVRRLRNALSSVERHIKSAQHELATLGFTEHDRTTQIALRQELRRALHLIVRYQELAGTIQPTKIDEHLKEPTNYAA